MVKKFKAIHGIAIKNPNKNWAVKTWDEENYIIEKNKHINDNNICKKLFQVLEQGRRLVHNKIEKFLKLWHFKGKK